MADAGSTRATRTSRPATRHPWRDMASTLAADVGRIGIDPRPCFAEDLHPVDAGPLERVMQLGRAGCRDQFAVAKQANVRGLRRAHVQFDPPLERELLAHLGEREAASVRHLVIGDVTATLAQRGVDERAVVLELTCGCTFAEDVRVQLLERALVTHEPQRHPAGDAYAELVRVEPADRG